MEIAIKRIKLLKDNKLEIGFSRTENGETVHVTEKHNAIAHPDLMGKLRALNVHLGVLSETIEAPKSLKKYPAELVEMLTTTAYSIGGKDDDEGIVLTGQKKLSTGKVLIMNTPFIRFDEVEIYRHVEHLRTTLDELEAEVVQYLEGKHAPDPQGELVFTAGEEN